MRNIVFSLMLVLIVCTALNAQKAQMVLEVDVNDIGPDVPETLYGVFLEEINHAGDGGLYGELLMNRSFEDRVKPDGYKVDNGELVTPTVVSHLTGDSVSGRYKWGTEPFPGWDLELSSLSQAKMSLTTEKPNFKTAPTSLKVEVLNAGEGVSLVNKGFWGIGLQKGENYRLRIFMRSDVKNGSLNIRLLGFGDKVLGKDKVPIKKGDGWQEYTMMLHSSDTTSCGRLSIEFPANGTYYFDYVSLFPENTYKGRKNGMRRDVAEFLEDLQPAFIRWPGGCIVEGITLNNRVQWKQTLGDPAGRPGEYDTWGYRNSYGIGYKEFLDFCEDIGAKGMYVCNVGLACQFRTGEACPDEEVESYLQDALDAIEYAIGNVDTPWGAIRAKEGHPEPYPLEYVEIGNENWGPLYNKRFNLFYDAIKKRYPQLMLISTHGMGGLDEAKVTDMIDPHWYVSANFFFNNADMFDSHKRGDYKIYVGEFACNRNVGGGNMLAALSEAAFMTGMERNSDLVVMSSYAPLLENKNDRGWPTNLIWLDNNQVVGRSSYYVQKMFAENKPTYNVGIRAVKEPEVEGQMDFCGYIGLGTWNTQMQFRNLSVTDRFGKTRKPNMADSTQWVVAEGEWAFKDGSFVQKSTDAARSAIIWKDYRPKSGDTIEFEINKISGTEGFIAYIGLTDLSLKKDGYMLNACGWGNTATAVEQILGGKNSPVSDFTGDRMRSGSWNKVRIVLDENSLTYYIDGRQVLVYSDNPVKKLFHVAGFDEKAQELVVKVVNASSQPCLSQIGLNGGEFERVGRVITLSASSADDENSFLDPYRIFPKEKEYDGFSSLFEYEFQPNSVTILRIKKKS